MPTLSDRMPEGTLRMGQGPPLVFLHGFGSIPETYRPTLEALATEATVVAPDWTRLRAAWTPARAARLVRRTLDAVSTRDAVVVGHSFGGALAVEFAARHPDRVTHLVLVDSIAQSAQLLYVRRILQGDDTGPSDDERTDDEQSDDERTDDGGTSSASSFLRTWARAPVTLTTAALTAFFTSRDEAIRRVRDAGLPCTVLWGRGDTVLAPRDGAHFAERLGAPFRAVDVQGGPVRHQWPIRHPDLFAETLREAIAGSVDTHGTAADA